LSIRKNHFGARRAFSEFFLCSPVTHSFVPFSRPHSLYLVSRLMSYVSVPCLPSSVTCLTCLFLASCLLSPVLHLLSPFLCPCLTSLFWSPVLYTLSHVICPLSPILLSPSPKPYQLSQSPISLGLQYSTVPVLSG